MQRSPRPGEGDLEQLSRITQGMPFHKYSQGGPCFSLNVTLSQLTNQELGILRQARACALCAHILE